MQYFKIKHSLDLTVIGAFPQVSEGVYPGNFDSPAALGSIMYRKTPANVEVPKGKLQPKAKFTDFMSVFLIYKLLVSTKLKSIITQHQSFGYEWFPAVLIKKKVEYDNYWFGHPYQAYTEALDLQLSTFAYYDIMAKKVVQEHLTFNTAAELDKAYIENNLAAPLKGLEHTPLLNNHIVLKENLSIDFFFLRNIIKGHTTYCVSERLREKIEQEKCTGLVFMDLNAKYP
jgi:hypothetical protein